MGGVHARAVRAAGAVLVGVADNDLGLAHALQVKGTGRAGHGPPQPS
jgi:hypothetical protein